MTALPHSCFVCTVSMELVMTTGSEIACFDFNGKKWIPWSFYPSFSLLKQSNRPLRHHRRRVQQRLPLDMLWNKKCGHVFGNLALQCFVLDLSLRCLADSLHDYLHRTSKKLSLQFIQRSDLQRVSFHWSICPWPRQQKTNLSRLCHALW